MMNFNNLNTGIIVQVLGQKEFDPLFTEDLKCENYLCECGSMRLVKYENFQFVVASCGNYEEGETFRTHCGQCEECVFDNQ